MTKAETCETVADFGKAAMNATMPDSDGVQIQANCLYLIAQFLKMGAHERQKNKRYRHTQRFLSDSPQTHQSPNQQIDKLTCICHSLKAVRTVP